MKKSFVAFLTVFTIILSANVSWANGCGCCGGSGTFKDKNKAKEPKKENVMPAIY